MSISSKSKVSLALYERCAGCSLVNIFWIILWKIKASIPGMYHAKCGLHMSAFISFFYLFNFSVCAVKARCWFINCGWFSDAFKWRDRLFEMNFIIYLFLHFILILIHFILFFSVLIAFSFLFLSFCKLFVLALPLVLLLLILRFLCQSVLLYIPFFLLLLLFLFFLIFLSRFFLVFF